MATDADGRCLSQLTERPTLLSVAPSYGRTPNGRAPRRRRLYSPTQLNLGHLYHRQSKKYLGTRSPDHNGYAALLPRATAHPATFYLSDSYDPEHGTYQRVTLVTAAMRQQLPSPISLKEAWTTARRLDVSQVGIGHLGWIREAPVLARNKLAVSLPLFTNDRAFKLMVGAQCLGRSGDGPTRIQSCGRGGDSPEARQHNDERQLWVWCPEHQFETCEWAPSS